MYPIKLQIASLYLTLNDDTELTECPVRVIEVHEDTVVTEAPIGTKGYPIRVSHGEKLRLGYVQNGAFYSFDTTMLRYLTDTIPLLVLQKPGKEKIHKVQRRSYFRVPVMVEAVVQPLPEQPVQSETAEQNPEQIKMTVVDLSGGGFAFRLKFEKLKQEQLVTGMLPLLVKNRLHRVPFVASVRRVYHDPEINMYHYSLEFSEIQERDREIVLQYCFQRQLHLRNRS